MCNTGKSEPFIANMLFLRCSNKRGQFFIMTAIILSVFLLSMTLTVNEVVATEKDNNFYNYADGIERESSNVLDYQVFSDVPVGDLADFVSKLEVDFQDKELSGNFLFIYGNSSLIRVKNLGAENIELNGETGEISLDGSGSVVESRIRVAGIGNVVAGSYNTDNEYVLEDIGNDDIEVSFNEQVYKFPVSDVNQVIFIIQKDVGDETYVEVR